MDYWKLIIEQREKIIAVLKETDWIEAKNKNGVKVSYRQTDKGKIFHLEVELDASPAIARRYVTPGPKGLRGKALKKHPVKEFNMIEETEKYLIAYEIFHGAMLGIISDRDVVSVYGGEDESDIGAYMINCSVEHPNYPPQSKPVRAIKHLGGQLFFPVEGDPNKCIMHGIMHIELGGMLPAFVISSFQSSIMLEGGIHLKEAVIDKLHEKNMD